MFAVFVKFINFRFVQHNGVSFFHQTGIQPSVSNSFFFLFRRRIFRKNNFKITNVEIIQGNQQHLAINFSDPLKKDQNFKGLVTIQNIRNPRFVIDGNVLKVFYDSQITGTADLSVFQGIKNTDDYKLKSDYKNALLFEELKPQVRLVNTGSILPNSKNLKFKNQNFILLNQFFS